MILGVIAVKQFNVNDRVYLPRVIDVWAKVNDTGTVTEVKSQGYTVKFDHSGTIGGLQDHELALLESDEDKSGQTISK